MIISKHMESLLNMVPVSSNYDLKGLRKICDLVEVHVRELKALLQCLLSHMVVYYRQS